MRFSVNLPDSLSASVREFKERRSLSLNAAVNILVEKGLESLKRDGAEAAAGRAAASAKLAAQSSYAALLASTVDVINLASIGNDERLVYYQFRDRDLASVSRFFMEAGRAASDNERARTKVWPSFKGAAKASGDPGLDPGTSSSRTAGNRPRRPWTPRATSATGRTT